MSRWYYLQKGRPFGPITTQELKTEIQTRRLGARDLIFKERDTEWREVSQFSELQVTSSQHRNFDKNSDEWVLLVRKNEAYRQLGPFTRANICSKLQMGEIAFTDYVWRKGLKEWYKIIALSEFRQPLSLSQISAQPNRNTSQEVMLPQNTSVGPPEPSTNAELIEITQKLPLPTDLTFQHAERTVKLTKTRVKNKSSRQKAQTISLAKRVSVMSYYAQLSPTRKIVFIAAAIFSVVSALLFVTYMSAYQDRRKLKLTSPTVGFVAPTRSVVTKPLLSTVELAPAKLSATNPALEKVVVEQKVVVDTKMAPTYIRALKEFDGSDNPRVKILTDGSHHYPITVTLNSESGRVLHLRSFVRKIRLYKTQDRLLELGKLSLLPGYYDLTLETDKLNHLLKINFATQSTVDFTKKLKLHRKQIFMYYMNERYDFIKTTTRLEKMTYLLMQNIESAPTSNLWTPAYRSWRKAFNREANPILKSINVSNRTSYVHASKWLRLKSLHAKVDSMAKDLNRIIIQGQSVSPLDVKNAAQELSKLKEEMILESLTK